MEKQNSAAALFAQAAAAGWSRPAPHRCVRPARLSIRWRRLWLSLLASVLWSALIPDAGADPLRPQRVAPGVYAFIGAPATPDPANRGMIANQGVIIGAQGVIVIGTGTSDAHGERLLHEIRRLSNKPVVLAIDAYAGPEHVLGNSAFVRRGIPILAHRETDRYMVQNCDNCIRNLAAAVGAATLAGTRLARPTRLIDAATSLKVAGRSIDILYFGATQQPGSIAAFDRRSGVLFAGALATFDVLPDAHDADLAGWIAALDAMARLPVKWIVPGRGPVAPPQRLGEVAEYLTGLRRQTLEAYRAGTGLASATRSLHLSRFEHWAGYDTVHPRNVHYQYLRLEAQDLAR